MRLLSTYSNTLILEYINMISITIEIYYYYYYNNYYYYYNYSMIECCLYS